MFRPKKFGIVGLLVLVLGLGSCLFVSADTVQTSPPSAKVREGSEPTMYEIGVRLSTLEAKIDGLNDKVDGIDKSLTGKIEDLDKSINKRVDDLQYSMWAGFGLIVVVMGVMLSQNASLSRKMGEINQASTMKSKESIEHANLLAAIRDLARTDPKVREALEKRHLL